MDLKRKHLEKFTEFALKTVQKANLITLKYFSKKIKHRLKENLSPVTTADIKSENFIISRIKEKFPEHSILAEESGNNDSGNDFKWLVDPIDGTKNFMRKYPFWGTLLALEYCGEIVMGIISMPAMNETIYASRGNGCFADKKRVKVSKVKKVSDSYLIHGGLNYIFSQPYRKNFIELVNSTNYDRGFGDCHGHTLIIKGQAEIMVDPHVSPWDVAPVKICIEEAGGRFTDIIGNNTIYSGSALVTNGKVHEEALKILNEDIVSREITKD